MFFFSFSRGLKQMEDILVLAYADGRVRLLGHDSKTGRKL